MNRDSLTKALAALEPIYKLTSAKQIAEFMRSKGIKGVQSDSSSCPLALWGQKTVKSTGLSMNFDGDHFTIYNGNDIDLDGTAAMAAFASNFDNDQYLDLVLPDEISLENAVNRVADKYGSSDGIIDVGSSSIFTDYSKATVVLYTEAADLKKVQKLVKGAEKLAVPFKVVVEVDSKVESGDSRGESFSEQISSMKMDAPKPTKKKAKKAKKAKKK